MSKAVTREDVLERLKTIEHPEIAVSLIDLGMILDVAVQGDKVKVAIALPMLNIPEAVREAILNSIAGPMQELGLETQAEYFEMAPDVRDRFFAASQANWKGAI